MRYNKHMHHNKYNQKGAVSLFVIIFAALLISVVTVSFTRLMISEQQQAVVVDLSKSANDSALAGVEDVKRAMVQYQECLNSESSTPVCASLMSDINSKECNKFVSSIVSFNGDEVLVQQSTNDLSLNQAYTCTLVKMQTTDFKGSLQPNGSKIIPLVGAKAFKSVTIRWFSNGDTQNVSNVDLEKKSTSQPLYTNWPIDRPPIMRVQLMQYGTNFTLSSFDENFSEGISNNGTVFLYPNGTKGAALPDNTSPDEVGIYGPRKSATITPDSITCSGDISAGGYACSAQINLPEPIGGGNRNAFIRLSSIYQGSSYSVELNDSSGDIVNFDGVQPEIDSTGRANDIFRRVKSRVEMADPNYPYPGAAVDISGNFCKNFVVTDNKDDYSTKCTP